MMPTPFRTAALVIAVVATLVVRAEDDQPRLRPGQSLADTLAIWKLEAAERGSFAGGPWNDERQAIVLRLLARLKMTPEPLLLRWRADAADASAALPTAGGDALVKVVGRAVYVAPLPLSAEESAVTGGDHLDVVRLVTAAGAAVDAIVEAAPRAWPRWQAIDEPASAIGLPLAAGGGPAPAATEGSWPDAPAALLLLATRVAWHPSTMLGGLGMDYSSFDTVADGEPLVAGDTEAFYGLLAAAAAAKPEALAEAAASAPDILTLIDPRQQWFAKRRGDVITIEGTARKVTRITIDDPTRRKQVGADHYWELFVFVPTPLIQVDKKVQDDFPVVCCVRSLPQGMPTGDNVGERVRITGFGLKRYGYQLPAVKISSSQGDSTQQARRRETPLVIAGQLSWTPRPSPQRTVTTLGWIFLSIAAAIGLVLALAAWSFARDAGRAARKARAGMPDRIQMPPAE
jgi:hypothetical protein